MFASPRSRSYLEIPPNGSTSPTNICVDTLHNKHGLSAISPTVGMTIPQKQTSNPVWSGVVTDGGVLVCVSLPQVACMSRTGEATLAAKPLGSCSVRCGVNPHEGQPPCPPSCSTAAAPSPRRAGSASRGDALCISWYKTDSQKKCTCLSTLRCHLATSIVTSSSFAAPHASQVPLFKSADHMSTTRTIALVVARSYIKQAYPSRLSSPTDDPIVSDHLCVSFPIHGNRRSMP